MAALVIVQHPVPSFEGWKEMFDSDPVGRKEHGVERYWIARSAQADYVMVGLEFATLAQAEAFEGLLEENLRSLWESFGGAGQVARVLEVVEEATV